VPWSKLYCSKRPRLRRPREDNLDVLRTGLFLAEVPNQRIVVPFLDEGIDAAPSGEPVRITPGFGAFCPTKCVDPKKTSNREPQQSLTTRAAGSLLPRSLDPLQWPRSCF
jgi:hypothetical protein